MHKCSKIILHQDNNLPVLFVCSRVPEFIKAKTPHRIVQTSIQLILHTRELFSKNSIVIYIVRPPGEITAPPRGLGLSGPSP